MYMSEMIDKIKTHKNNDAIIWHDQSFSYEWLVNEIDTQKNNLHHHDIKPGDIIEIDGDYTPKSIAVLLALVGLGCIVVPLTQASDERSRQLREIAQVESRVMIDAKEKITFLKYNTKVDHPILLQLKKDKHPGLVLFSSGSTGQPKAAVHDWTLMLEKYRTPGKSNRVIVFLLFDHIGGINTLLHTLFNGGCVIVLKDHSPHSVCEAISKHRAQVLPVSPTFLNLFLVSHLYDKYDLSSLELVTYGTEVMPDIVLNRFHDLFPHVRVIQTYGLSELGILKTKSKSSNSVYIKICDDNKIRVQNGMLEIKAKSAMIGYLNAESPFTEDGWFKTGDMVEIDGEFIHILGRASEIINVGGQKIFPTQVENVIEQIENVDDVIVTGESNPITGQIVKATIKLSKPEELSTFRKKMSAFCKGKLELFAIPQKIVFVDKMPYNNRFKKSHKADTEIK